jgi:hypothetical protein
MVRKRGFDRVDIAWCPLVPDRAVSFEGFRPFVSISRRLVSPRDGEFVSFWLANLCLYSQASITIPDDPAALTVCRRPSTLRRLAGVTYQCLRIRGLK